MTDRFGPYELHERVGVGGMAEVFRAVRVGAAGFAREVCIKRVLPALCDDATFVALFREEARVGAMLRHGNLVAIDDFGEVDGRWFLAMEWMSGGDLATLVRALRAEGRVLPPEVVLHVADEVLKGLDYVHRKVDTRGRPLGIVHRDVSPHNVLLTRAGGVKLGDFGIARGAGRTVKTTRGVVRGKLAYVAPEQLSRGGFDARADLFALGVTVYQALAGVRPFDAPDDVSLVRLLLKGDYAPLVHVPPAVAAWVDGLLARDPAARTPTAHDARTALVSLGVNAAAAETLAAILAGRVDPASLPHAPREATEPRLTRGDTPTRTLAKGRREGQ